MNARIRFNDEGHSMKGGYGSIVQCSKQQYVFYVRTVDERSRCCSIVPMSISLHDDRSCDVLIDTGNLVIITYNVLVRQSVYSMSL